MGRENTRKVLELLADIAISQNSKPNAAQEELNWGVLFNTINTNQGRVDEAFVVSKALIARVSEVGPLYYEQDAPYFHLVERKFVKSKLNKGIEDIHKGMSSCEIRHLVRIPYGNLITLLLGGNNAEAISRSRIIIKPEHGVLTSDNTVLCIFNENMVYHPQLAPKPYVLDKFSRLPRNEVAPGKIYVCTIVNETDDAFFVSARRKYFKGIRFGLWETPRGGFFPSEQELYDFENYRNDRLMSLPFFLEGDYMFEPLHIAASVLADSAKLLNGFEWVDLHVGPSPLHPVIITGFRTSKDAPLIECFAGPLNPHVRGTNL